MRVQLHTTGKSVNVDVEEFDGTKNKWYTLELETVDTNYATEKVIIFFDTLGDVQRIANQINQEILRIGEGDVDDWE